MTYNPNVPLGNQTISSTQSPIQTNFDQANIGFGIDHQPFTDNTATQGIHKKTTYNLQPADPAAVVAGPIVYSKAVTYPGPRIKDELFIRQDTTTGSVVTQLTNFFNNPTLAPDGSSYLPGGLLIQWGSVSPIVLATTSVPFINGGFPNKCINVQITAVRNSDSASVVYVVPGSVSTTQFNFRSSSASISSIYWFAIGY